MSEFLTGKDDAVLSSKRPHCSDCDRDMWLVNIKPADTGFELQTFECARCAASQTILTHERRR